MYVVGEKMAKNGPNTEIRPVANFVLQSLYTFIVQHTWFIFQVRAIAIKQGLFLTHATNAAYMAL